MQLIATEALSSSLPDMDSIRSDFPLFHTGVDTDKREPPLVYLDSAATSQKPSVVIDAIADCYRRYNAPIYRGLYPLSTKATECYEQARTSIARFIGAQASEHVLFTSSATDAVNRFALGWLQPRLKPDDEIWVTRMEHHSNFLPWQQLCRQTGARLRMIELHPDGTLDLAGAHGLYGPRTRLIALTYVSNVLGVINPIQQIVAQASAKGIPVLVDAAQAVAHFPVDVGALDCDFLVFSAHKMCGPCGIGALYAKPERLEEMMPVILGGGMVDVVDDQDATWMPSPQRFEAGSPNLAGAMGFAAAAEYLNNIGMGTIQKYIADLTQQAYASLSAIPGVHIYGPDDADKRAGILAFNVTGIHAHDLGQLAGEQGVALRAGHHCCQPLLRHLGVAATVRASFALYNGAEDIPRLVEAVQAARRMFL